MPNLFDYLAWRGDVTFRQAPLNEVDALVLSTLSYVQFREMLPSEREKKVTLEAACQAFFTLPEPEQEKRLFYKNNGKLLKLLAQSPRYRDLMLFSHREELDFKLETQFAAMAVGIAKDEYLICFRGTDNTLVGWKEDFNLSFQPEIPAQRKALSYFTQFAGKYSGTLSLAGHSKGGNLAVYAAACAPAKAQRRIRAIYNYDGPGFSEGFAQRMGYQAVVPRIYTYIPQSSVVGLLLERGEGYRVVKSRQIGLLQHDPYSWEVMGASFVTVEESSPGSRMANRTLNHWLLGLSNEEREEFVEAVYTILQEQDMQYVEDLLEPKRLYQLIRSLGKLDEERRILLSNAMRQLVRSARAVLREGEEASSEEHTG